MHDAANWQELQKLVMRHILAKLLKMSWYVLLCGQVFVYKYNHLFHAYRIITFCIYLQNHKFEHGKLTVQT